jgi:hypothetical protein
MARPNLSSTFGAGPNGVNYNVGNPVNINLQVPPLIEAGQGTSISDFMPANSSDRRHWDNANPYGPYLLRKGLNDGTLNPENIGWPVAPVFRAYYNFNDGLPHSSWTGTYDADGGNA